MRMVCMEQLIISICQCGLEKADFCTPNLPNCLAWAFCAAIFTDKCNMLIFPSLTTTRSEPTIATVVIIISILCQRALYNVHLTYCCTSKLFQFLKNHIRGPKMCSMDEDDIFLEILFLKSMQNCDEIEMFITQKHRHPVHFQIRILHSLSWKCMCSYVELVNSFQTAKIHSLSETLLHINWLFPAAGARVVSLCCTGRPGRFY